MRKRRTGEWLRGTKQDSGRPYEERCGLLADESFTVRGGTGYLRSRNAAVSLGCRRKSAMQSAHSIDIFSGVVGQKSRREKQMQFSDRNDCGCTKFQVCFALNFFKVGVFSFKFCISARKFFDKRKIFDNYFPTAKN